MTSVAKSVCDKEPGGRLLCPAREFGFPSSDDSLNGTSSNKTFHFPRQANEIQRSLYMCLFLAAMCEIASTVWKF